LNTLAKSYLKTEKGGFMKDETEHHSSVNWRKVLENYRGSYTYNEEWEITIIEIISNAIDAAAKEIKIQYVRKAVCFRRLFSVKYCEH